MSSTKAKKPYRPPLKTYVDPAGEHLPTPILCYKDDIKDFKQALRRLPASWRDKVASNYATIFLCTLHDSSIPQIQRVGKARFKANTWLREFLNKQHM